ncbi:MAG: lipopolysaccharide biosynthesis protein [Vicinamibacterales bacterium]
MFARLQRLARQLLVYGLGDVATSVISFLLLPIYVRYLSPEDYGVIGLLLSVEVASKIVYRWGVDASFMRLYYDCHDQRDRQRLASTIFFFLLVLNGSLLIAALALAPAIGTWLFGRAGYETVLRLVLVNTFIGGFYFIPFHVLRIQGRTPQFIGLTISRSLSTLVLRLVLVIGFNLGVLGVVMADIIVTAGFTLLLTRWFAPLIRPMLSTSVLREALAFGLPRLPHGLAHQVIAVADRYILTRFVTLREIGLYSVGATFGLTMKLFLSAFEYAWAPFYFSTMTEPDAKRTFSVVTTYGIAILALLVAGLAAVAPDLVRLMTKPEFLPAAEVIPWIGLGVLFQGVYLLTSIGLNITKQTAFYPVATLCAAATSVTANLLLVPRFGAQGAAWANTMAYLVLAAVGMGLSQRFYPMRYEWNRIVRIALAGTGAFLAARLMFQAPLPAFWGVVSRGGLVLVLYPLLLIVLGFHDAREVRAVAQLFKRVRRGRPAAAAEDTTELAGEVVTAPMPDETEDVADVSPESDREAAAERTSRT